MSSTHFNDIAGGIPVSVSLQQVADGAPNMLAAAVDGSSVDVELIELGDTAGVMRIRGRMVPFYFIRRKERIDVWIAGRTWSFEYVSRVARRATGGAAKAVQESITAPMPGTILKINVSAGDRFEAHQPLVVMESMKMEITLSAPHSGRVKELLCRPGQLVEMGAVLARIEKASSEESTGVTGETEHGRASA